jgi:hypothetical protein
MKAYIAFTLKKCECRLGMLADFTLAACKCASVFTPGQCESGRFHTSLVLKNFMFSSIFGVECPKLLSHRGRLETSSFHTQIQPS